MVGFYMDAPSHRLAWDRDGSLCTTFTSSGNILVLDATTKRNLNSETPAAYGMKNSRDYVAIVFPMPYDCSAVFIALASNNANYRVNATIQTSKDTTNGFDGTWTTHTTTLFPFTPTKPNYRQASDIFNLIPGAISSGLRGIRFRAGLVWNVPGDQYQGEPAVSSFHVYGTPSNSAPKSRLSFRLAGSDTEIPPTFFDWGNVPRSSSADRTFRLKNLSDTMTAEDISLYMEALTPGTPSVAGMHTLSVDGGATFGSLVSVSDLAPGELSSPIILRRTIPDNAMLSVWSARVAADVGLWSV